MARFLTVGWRSPGVQQLDSILPSARSSGRRDVFPSWAPNTQCGAAWMLPAAVTAGGAAEAAAQPHMMAGHRPTRCQGSQNHRVV